VWQSDISSKKETKMKIIFVLDDQSVIVTSPEELQLRQIQPNLAALALPAGKNDAGEELFRPLITYPVSLVVVPTEEPEAAKPDTADAPAQQVEVK
jgi:hypothetical protein